MRARYQMASKPNGPSPLKPRARVTWVELKAWRAPPEKCNHVHRQHRPQLQYLVYLCLCYRSRRLRTIRLRVRGSLGSHWARGRNHQWTSPRSITGTVESLQTIKCTSPLWVPGDHLHSHGGGGYRLLSNTPLCCNTWPCELSPVGRKAHK